MKKSTLLMCEIVASILLMAVPYAHAQVQVQTTGTPGSPSAMCALRIGTVKNSKNFLRVDWAGARDDGCGVAKESGETTASVAMPFISGMPGFCLSMRFH